MNSFGFTMDRLEISLDRLQFTRDQMSNIGQTAVNSELERLARGIDSNDQPARPLNPRYEKYKQNTVGRSDRDSRFTGEMLASFGVRDAGENYSLIGFGSERAEIKAERCQRLAPMIGLSPTDEAATVKQAEKHFASNVKNCIVQK